MLRVSKLADYATVIMHFLAKRPEEKFSAAEVAAGVHIAIPTVSKVLKMLAEAELVISVRGAQGGYRLARPAGLIRLLDIVAAVDGFPALTECAQHSTVCQQEGLCAVKGNWRLLNRLIISAMEQLSLADMTKPLAEHPIFQRPLSHWFMANKTTGALS